MKKLFLMRAILLGSLLVLGLPFAAHATSITIGGGLSTITFTGNGAGSVSVSTSGLSDGAFFDSDPLGSYSLGATSFNAGPVSAGIFPAGANSESFSFLGGDGDSLSGTVHWSFIQDNTTQPKFFGVLTIGAKSGDAAFLSNFSGPTANIDFTTNALSSGSTLDALAVTTSSATATVSSGEVVPAVPEPGTLALFGSGLVALGGLIRRKLLQA